MCNHAPDIAAMDLFVVPTLGVDLLYAFVVIQLDRRELAWINVTANPTAEWVARQITEAFPWDEAPGYMIRDRDRIYGSVVTRRLRGLGIRDRPTAPAELKPDKTAYTTRDGTPLATTRATRPLLSNENSKGAKTGSWILVTIRLRI